MNDATALYCVRRVGFGVRQMSYGCDVCIATGCESLFEGLAWLNGVPPEKMIEYLLHLGAYCYLTTQSASDEPLTASQLCEISHDLMPRLIRSYYEGDEPPAWKVAPLVTTYPFEHYREGTLERPATFRSEMLG